jgi:catechol 2,3-dioxygenase-like lactoylglutathione lyase family enzyme
MRLNQVAVATHDVERAIAFYRTLGLELIVRAPHYARFVCPDGRSTFSVHLTSEPIVAGTVVYFECDDVDAQVGELERRGVVFASQPADQRWLWREARLVDPDGNAICLYFAGASRIDPPWKVEGSTEVA